MCILMLTYVICETTMLQTCGLKVLLQSCCFFSVMQHVGLVVAAVQLKAQYWVKFGLLCCSGQIDLAAAGLKPCAIKTLPYSTEVDKMRAEAELQALYDARYVDSVMACYGVFLDTTPDGSHRLQLVTM